MLVGTGRFELPTPRTPSECSTRLSHVPTRKESAISKQRIGLTQEFYTTRPNSCGDSRPSSSLRASSRLSKPGAPSEVSLLAGVTKLYYFCLPLRFDLRWGFDELRDNGGKGWGCSKIAN